MLKKKIKTQVFEIPYRDYEETNNYNIVYGFKGNPIVIFKINNPIQEFSGDVFLYEDAHMIFEKIIKTIGVGYFIQKIDVIQKEVYKMPEIDEGFMLKQFHENFENRVYKNLYTYIAISPSYIEKKSAIHKWNKKNNQEFFDIITSVKEILMTSKMKPVNISLEEVDLLLRKQIVVNYDNKSTPSAENMLDCETHLRIGEKFVKVLSLVDTDNMIVPEYISDVVVRNGRTLNDLGAYPVDCMRFMLDSDSYETFIYNQIVEIPPQQKITNTLRIKKNRSESMKNAANALSALDIQEMLDDVSANNELIARAHFSFLYSCDSKESMNKVTNELKSLLYDRGFVVNTNSFNQTELFRTFFLGNATELREYDMFLTKISSACCFFFMESKMIDDVSDYYVYFNDREGRPIKVDTDDLPMRDGRASNRNMFVLGVSGTGKSFSMNTILSQWVRFDNEIVIIDTGDSYSGLCDYLGGRYIQYKEDKPITMNPFNISIEERNNEKIIFLQNLIVLLYVGSEGDINDIERELINNSIIEYYNRYFDREERWYEKVDDQYLLDYLNSYGYEVDNYSSEKKKEDESKLIGHNYMLDYYAVLNIDKDASIVQIKDKYRELAKIHHPDKGGNAEFFTQIGNAYKEILKDKAINQSKEDIRQSLVKYVKIIDEKLKVTSLSFNSYFEFALNYMNLASKGRKIMFKIHDFSFKLSKFYKGGRFDTLLNENSDSTLFNEKFIVFEIDNIKEDPVLFPIVTLIIMDLFIQKMRLSKNRKALIIEEAWKALTSKLMAQYILYLYKTVRKFYGQCIVVTQEISDIIGNPIVKESIIANSDKVLLMDMSKVRSRFDELSDLLSLDKIEKNKILTIGQIDNKKNRGFFREFYLKIGLTGNVYGNEVSNFQYFAFTTEKPEKECVKVYVKHYGNYEEGIINMISDIKKSKLPKNEFIKLINKTEKIYEKASFSYA